jgi:hypothetical protein
MVGKIGNVNEAISPNENPSRVRDGVNFSESSRPQSLSDMWS